jgi:uncharacterized membrane protein
MTDGFYVTSCNEKAPETKTNESSGTEETSTTPTETTTTSTSIWTTTTSTSTTTTTSSITAEKEESTSTTTASKQEKTQEKTKQVSFIGRFLDAAGKASILAAILIIAFMVLRTLLKEEPPKEGSFWQKEGTSRLEKT